MEEIVLMENKNIQKFCGIDIFSWKEWDEVEAGSMMFYDIEFCVDSMKQYNGNYLYFGNDGKIEVYSDSIDDTNKAHTLFSGYVSDIPEVLNELNCRELKRKN